MSDLPRGWEWTTIGEVADVQLGRQRSPKNHDGPHMRPYLRSANVTWRGIDVSDVKSMNFEPAEATVFELKPGDLLLNEASGSPNEVGKPAIWRGEIQGCCFQNTLLRVQPRQVSVDYLYWYCWANALDGRFGEAGRGVNIRHLGKAGLASFPLALPPLAEQVRIVAAIEEHLSGLDTAEATMRALDERLALARRATVSSLIKREWPRVALGEVTTNFDGRRVPLKRSDRAERQGPYPYFGASGVIDHLDSYLFDGDFLLVAEDGANLVTRAKPIAFSARGKFWVNNHAHVLQPVAGVERKYLEIVLNNTDIQRSITGSAQPKLTQANLNRLQVPLPPDTHQRSVVEQHDLVVSLASSVARTVKSVVARSQSLRRSILGAAFAGQLVPQDPEDEPAAELLGRIQAEAARSPKRLRKAQAS